MIEPRRPRALAYEVCVVVLSAITGWGRTARLCAVIMTSALALLATAVAVRVAGAAAVASVLRAIGRF